MRKLEQRTMPDADVRRGIDNLLKQGFRSTLGEPNKFTKNGSVIVTITEEGFHWKSSFYEEGPLTVMQLIRKLKTIPQ